MLKYKTYSDERNSNYLEILASCDRWKAVLEK